MKMKSFVMPQIGMGVTQHFGTYRFPYTVIDVMCPTRVVISPDMLIPDETHSFYATQRYHFSKNKNGERVHIALRKGNRWVEVGSKKRPDVFFELGRRFAFLDDVCKDLPMFKRKTTFFS